MSGAPLASVIVATHDRVEVVGRAVASALGQTVRDIEVVVVDDHSGDGTTEVLADIAARDERVRVIRLAYGEGGSAARVRNVGLSLATAPVVAFLDDDDEWLPTKLERQLACLDQQPDVLLVGCHLAVVGPEGGSVELRGPDLFDERELLWIDHLHGASCVALRMEDPRLAGLRFDESFPAIEDWDLYARVAARGAVALVPEVLVRYHVHGGPRLTTGPHHVEGHRMFLERHGPRMSTAARSYHHARLRLLGARGARANLFLVPSLVSRTPPRVLALLLREIVAARIGAWRGDPGRGHRAVHAALRGDDRLLDGPA